MKSVRQLHEEGLQQVIDEAAAAESTKTGTFRGGNAGFVDANGKPAASCVRKMLLRYEGVQLEPVDVNKQLMFDGGLASEDYFIERVRRSWEASGGTVACEEDYPTRWNTSSGIPVTGRPDGVLLLKDGKPVKGIEKKGIFSLWTARDIMERRPKLVNLAQATNYMMSAGLDSYELVYINRSYFAVNEMAARHVPKWGEKWSEYLSYRFYKWRPKQRGDGWTRARIEEDEFAAANKAQLVSVKVWNYDEARWETKREFEYQAEPGNINPFCISYEMRAVGPDGSIEIRDTTDADAEWVSTPLSFKNVRDWYEMGDAAVNLNKLPPPPTNPKLNKSRDGYSLCGYCPLNSFCNSKTAKPKTTQEFLEGAKKLLTEST